MQDLSPLIRRLIRIGLFFGLAYGLLEGLAALGLSQIPGGLSWNNGTAPPVLLVAPIFYGLVYVFLALALALPALRWPSWRWDVLLVGLLATISALMLSRLQRNLLSPPAALILGLGVGLALRRRYAARRDAWSEHMRRHLPALAATVALAGLAGGYLVPSALEQVRASRLGPVRGNGRNVLLLVIDTERADHLSVYGYARHTTPRLDSLARAGARFEWVFATAPTTLPSHASIMTGLPVHLHRAGLPRRQFLDHRYPTLAEVLSAYGYRTGGFVANVFFAGRASGLNRGFLHYEDYFGHLGDALCRTELGRRLSYWILPRLGLVDIPGRKDAALVNREFLDWVGKKQGRPFFAFLNYLDQHAPYLPPAASRGRFGPEPKTPDWMPRRVDIGAWNENTTPPDSSILSLWRQRYDESLTYVDTQIGLLLDSLRTRGLLQNTVVIVTSDHGEAFGEHGMIHHGGALYPEQVRVPLIVWRAHAPWAGTTEKVPVSLAALPGSITRWLGIEDAPFPGVGVRATLTRVGQPSDPVLMEAPFLAANPSNWPTGQGRVWSLVSRDGWQLIHSESGGTELYDLTSDPRDLQGLEEVPAQESRARRMFQRLRSLVPSLLTTKAQVPEVE